MLLLAIETSCDETAAAVVKDGREILSNIVASQIEFHQKYGGIVPEIASRKHLEVVNLVIKQALSKAEVSFSDLNAIAVTYGPGLVGALLVGICAAKALAYALNIPLIGVNHIEGHIYANFLNSPPFSPSLNKRGGWGVSFPFICLIVSGGHTMLVQVQDHGKYEVLGRTKDDAAGEAFDKIARFLGLPYPGGPAIDKLAKEGDPAAVDFPRAMLYEGYDFSFSGIKTAVINYVRSTIRPTLPIDAIRIPDIAASFQQAVVDVLVEKSLRAAREKKVGLIALAGGVSANSRLREELKRRAEAEGIKVAIPPLELCLDNAAMIAAAGYYKLQRGETSDFTLTAVSTLRL